MATLVHAGIAALVILVAAEGHADTAHPDAVDTFKRQKLQVESYKRADADLNGDGRRETVVYATDSCGSGGCDLFVLSPEGKSYRAVLEASVSQLPIRLLPTSTHGWRDIGVTVSGGGILRPYMARLRFTGRQYPDNPTVPPAIPLKRPTGKLLISR
jgi:hypothetical protein